MARIDPYTEFDWSAAALITVDLQNDFSLPGAVSEIPGTAAVVPTAGEIVRRWRESGRPICHLVRLYRRDGSNVDLARRSLVESGTSIVAPGSDGSQLVAELGCEPFSGEDLLRAGCLPLGPAEQVVYKPRWGGFYHTPLDELLREQGVSSVLLVGANWPNCPRSTLYEASERDYRTAVVDDAMSRFDATARREVEAIGTLVLAAQELPWGAIAAPV